MKQAAFTNHRGERVSRAAHGGKVTRSSDTEPGRIISSTHRPVRLIEEVRDAQRADGLRFYALALGFILLLALATGAIGALFDWVQTDLVEMTR